MRERKRERKRKSERKSEDGEEGEDEDEDEISDGEYMVMEGGGWILNVNVAVGTLPMQISGR